MVTYNPKDWIKFIVQIRKSDTLRSLGGPMLLLGLITVGVTYFLKKYFVGHTIPNLIVFHQISGFIISLVLVFRINSAYDRWWEGRKLWGSLLNNSRNLAIKLNAILPADNKNDREELSTMVGNFAYALKEHLRDGDALPQMKFTDRFTSDEFESAPHKPNLIATKITKLAMSLCGKPSFPDEYLVISENIDDMTEICGACERIRNTPIPYAYSIFIKKIVFVYVITMPISFGLNMGYWSVPMVMIMFYAFASLELISEEIEDPFGTDDNDLPTDEIAEKIMNNTKQILCQ